MDNAADAVIAWATAARTLAGESESGDRYWVKQTATHAWLAVLDGAGHGSEAARAARAAIAMLEQHAGEPLPDVFERCHEQLRPTRGAVMSLAEFSARDNTMAWLGVGNVEGIILPRRAQISPRAESLFLRPGLLGVRLPALRASMVNVSAGDTIVLATDGVREGFSDHIRRQDSPQEIAEWILREYGRDTDDALVLVARYLDGKTNASTR